MNRLELLFKEYPTLEGWCTEEKAKKMIEHLPEHAQLAVELGVFAGKSLLPVSIMCKGTVFGIDAWSPQASLEGTNDITNDEWWKKIDYPYFQKYTQDLLTKYKCDNTKLLRMTSREAIKNFEDNSIDFLHQDSNHSEEVSCEEVELYYQKVKSGGTWVFDDTNWPTTRKAQNLLVEKGAVELVDHGDWKLFKKI
jgi:hypothetical protein